ncbi:NAD(P)-dependent oxidoreductase [archaeon]|jgi:nucleoside-diphosphate-sugar epimerase|nr:NAD(P)-dependent oxidoreductase [archaeon]MBT3451365.1 NAD(P)-dependent oxidoreductase [archaeon]MBT6869319.1 NAD(P)-dependent oxidoreductase [archaeon]MBT7192482.1 NAD(P)-dependent oxidoreductase [archaeon]MBT7380558.1 NAD(P)-dependent oxidoreductase [archaeon]
MKVVITGSESFVGKKLIEKCLEKGIEVIGLDYSEANDVSYKFHKVDIRDKNVKDYIPQDVDALIHLAALSTDNLCKDKAYECFDVNVMGTLNLINAAANKNVKQFIFASSEWVYDNFVGTGEKNEESMIDITNLNSEYALSKLVSECNLRQKHKHGFGDVTILRFGIIYGFRKANWCAVESFFDQVENNKKINVGSLQSARKFIHISDIVNGIIKSLGLKGFNIINLEGSKLITLKDIINVSGKIFNIDPNVVENNPNNISVRNVSGEKAKNILGWEPMIDLEKGLRILREENAK